MAALYRHFSLKVKWKDTFLSDMLVIFLPEDIYPKLKGKCNTAADFSNVLELSGCLFWFFGSCHEMSSHFM